MLASQEGQRAKVTEVTLPSVDEDHRACASELCLNVGGTSASCRCAAGPLPRPPCPRHGAEVSPRPLGRGASAPAPLQTPAGPPAPWGNALRGHRPQERRRKMANLPADRTGPSRRGRTLVIARRSRAQHSGPGGLAHAAAHAWLAGWSSARGRGSAPSSRLSEPSGALRLARPRPREAPPGPGSRSAPEPGRALPAAPWL